MNATITRSGSMFAVDLDGISTQVQAVPPRMPFSYDSPIMLFWDAARMDQGEAVFAGIKMIGADGLTDADITALDGLDLPRVDIPAEGIVNATIADVLRREVAAFRAKQERSAA